jgi:hypothetical protein
MQHDQERVGERQTAFLKERGRVKVLVLVVSSAAGDAGARGSRAVVKVGLSGCAPGLVDLGSGRLGCQAFLR